MALDDVLNLGDLQQVTGPLGGAGVAVTGLYCSSPSVAPTRYIGMCKACYIGMCKACLFFVEHR
jgi:hypothetical protein